MRVSIFYLNVIVACCGTFNCVLGQNDSIVNKDILKVNVGYWDTVRNNFKYLYLSSEDGIQGAHLDWDESGNLLFWRSYNDGQLDGTSYSFYSNGKLKICVKHSQGELDGMYTSYYPSDAGNGVHFMGNYIPLTIADKYGITYNPTLKKSFDQRGVAIGTWKYFDPNGKLIQEDIKGDKMSHLEVYYNASTDTKLFYDEKGNLVLKQVYSKDGILVEQTLPMKVE